MNKKLKYSKFIPDHYNITTADPNCEGFITPKSLRDQIGRINTGSGRKALLDKEDLQDIFMDHIELRKSKLGLPSGSDL